MRSVVVVSVFVVGLLGLHGCGDQSSERTGGGGIPDLTAGSTATAGAGQTSEAGASDGGAGAAASGPVQWCDAYKVINCVCQQCHQDPPLHGAPIPLMTFEDTQAPFPVASSKEKVWQEMQQVVGNGFMPYTADTTIQPAVKPLDPEQKSTLLTWLAEGAHAEGGTDCPQACDWSDGTPEP